MCHPRLHVAYLSLSLLLGAGACALTASLSIVLRQGAHSVAYRPIRTAVFIALGLSGVLPMMHTIALYESHFVNEILGMRYVAIGGALYIIGALIYANHVPERFAPGMFDYVVRCRLLTRAHPTKCTRTH